MLCDSCGFTFCPQPQAPTTPPQRYCSEECRGQAYRFLMRSCAHKKRYPTAEAALADWVAWGNTTGGAYPCELCTRRLHFHNTRRSDAPFPVKGGILLTP